MPFLCEKNSRIVSRQFDFENVLHRFCMNSTRLIWHRINTPALDFMLRALRDTSFTVSNDCVAIAALSSNYLYCVA